MAEKENKLSLTQAEVNRLNKGAKQVNAMRAKEKAEQGKKKKEAPKPVQGAGNMPLNDEQGARQVEFLKSKNKEKEVKGMKKMNMGGMATANKYDRNTKERREEADMQSGRSKFEKVYPNQMPPMPPITPKMKKGGDVKGYNKGGKVRGAGMAKKGVRACKMR